MSGKIQINIVAIRFNTILFLHSVAKVLPASCASLSGQASNGGLAEARENYRHGYVFSNSPKSQGQ